MGRCYEKVFNEIFVAQCRTPNTSSSSTLAPILVYRDSLHEPSIGDDHYDIFLFNEILDVHATKLFQSALSSSLVSILGGDIENLLLHNLTNQVLVCKQFVIISNFII